MALVSNIVMAMMVTTAAADTGNVAGGTISPQETVDLSQDLVEDAAAIASSPGSLLVKQVATNDPFLRSAIVLEHGKVVAKYYREDPQKVDPTDTHQLWSTTKSWTSLLIGLMVDEGLLSLDDTLGDIFDNDNAWMGVADGTVDFRKEVTIEELLTMSSGLVTPEEHSLEKVFALPDEELATELQNMLNDGGSFGGETLIDSLAYPEVGPKGEYHYLGTSNILSYVIKERTGMTPREYLASKVMPALGIAEDEYNWMKNVDGVEMAFHGLEATVVQMAKFGQLYLQGGQAKPPSSVSQTTRTGSNEHQVISKEWVDASFTPHTESEEFLMKYGYLFWQVGANMWCTIGAYGQDTCIDQDTGRVIAQQRDRNPDNAMEGNLIMPLIASNSTLSFEAQDHTTLEETDSSSTSPATALALMLLGSSTLLFL